MKTNKALCVWNGRATEEADLSATAPNVKEVSVALATECRRIGAHDGAHHARDGDGGGDINVTIDDASTPIRGGTGGES